MSASVMGLTSDSEWMRCPSPPPTAVLQALAALLLLGEGGVFVCKLFECWTQSTAALVYLLHRKFRRIAIVKPITR